MRFTKLIGKAAALATFTGLVLAATSAAATNGAVPFGGEAGGNHGTHAGLIVINPQGSDSLIEIDRAINLDLTLINIGGDRKN
ncbi:hypothetical protein [Sciscionella marina]|uniref:hypothetical protein n=1 Tax=Sciscionella marina TaxID=508770 RepID=UPI00037DBEED|nr:hypothetical protein [Sciscionella marina]